MGKEGCFVKPQLKKKETSFFSLRWPNRPGAVGHRSGLWAPGGEPVGAGGLCKPPGASILPSDHTPVPRCQEQHAAVPFTRRGETRLYPRLPATSCLPAGR